MPTASFACFARGIPQLSICMLAPWFWQCLQVLRMQPASFWMGRGFTAVEASNFVVGCCFVCVLRPEMHPPVWKETRQQGPLVCSGHYLSLAWIFMSMMADCSVNVRALLLLCNCSGHQHVGAHSANCLSTRHAHYCCNLLLGCVPHRSVQPPCAVSPLSPDPSTSASTSVYVAARRSSS
jgi:hypothetical protein